MARGLLQLVRSPVAPEAREKLERAWAQIPARYRTPWQFQGRQYVGCTATIGLMPRCDFQCTGCYLGGDANRASALELDAVFAQLDRIAEHAGPGGNVQLTDGELTLRGDESLIAILQHAHALELVPMLMTHGDHLRRRPERLERLVRQGGLRELSVHVDTTQRGRRAPYAHPLCEADLNPLRDEFAELVRRTRRRTGRRLEVATTVTVADHNLADVVDIVRWAVQNADAIKMVSFQPMAQVGRTQPGIGGHVSVETLWEQIHKALELEHPERHQGWLGHPGCSRFVQGFVVDRDAGHRFVPLLERGRHDDLLRRWFMTFPGLTFRLDSPAQKAARTLGVLLRARPGLVRAGTAAALALGRKLGFRRGHYLNIVSHHFMSAAELESAQGQERLQACAFRVPIDGEMRSMCEVNALGLRDRAYEAQTR